MPRFVAAGTTENLRHGCARTWALLETHVTRCAAHCLWCVSVRVPVRVVHSCVCVCLTVTHFFLAIFLYATASCCARCASPVSVSSRVDAHLFLCRGR